MLQLPVDADDDLIESGLMQEQTLRGHSEVSIQLRQIQLRKITSRIRAGIYHSGESSLDSSLEEALGVLDQWRGAFPTIPDPRNVYETLEWRDLNYYRELLSLYRAVALPRSFGDPGAGPNTTLTWGPACRRPHRS